MKKALISPGEICSYDDNGAQLTGCRIVQVEAAEFPVAGPLFWTDCQDECQPDIWFYCDGQPRLVPVPPPPTIVGTQEL